MATELLMRGLSALTRPATRVGGAAGRCRLRVGLFLALSAIAATVQGGEPVEVVIDVRGQHGGGLPTETTIFVADPATREPAVAYSVSQASEPSTLELPAQAAGWLLWARAPGWWGPARYVAADRTSVSLVLAPQGVVRFAVNGVDRAVDGLDAGEVWIAGRVDAAGDGLTRGVHRGPCEVDRKRSRREVLIACPFARGERVDLRVRMGPFLPLLRSDVTITADTDLGLIEPVRGATVTGHVASVGEPGQLVGIRQPSARSFPWAAWTDSGGVFVFEGLSPGDYELHLAGSDGDNWPVRVESRSDWIDLGRISSSAANVLVVAFGAPLGMESDRFRPVARRVSLGVGGQVESRGRGHEPAAQRVDGSFVWRGLPAGDYEIDIADERGNRWQREVLRFHGQDHYYFELDAVQLVGRIERGGDPLEDVMLWFGGLWGAERVSLRSGEKGRFSGLLPREGFWPVEVTPLPACDPCEGGWDTDGWDGFDGSDVDDAGVVDVVAGADGAAHVSIDLPAGSVLGRVSWRNAETGAFEPVEGASVWVSPEPRAAADEEQALLAQDWRRATDDMGRFEIRGLFEGTYRIHALASMGGREYRSREDRFQVSDRESLDELRLVLEHQRRLTVVVRSGGLPVSGAQTFVRDPGTGLYGRNGDTDGWGKATHRLTAETTAVDVVVRADGLGMVGWRFDVKDGAPAVVEMRPDRGRLRVPDTWQAVLISPAGVAIPVFVLAAINDNGQVQTAGDEYVIRDLAPGTWQWCSAPGACRAGDVLPWAETSISP